MSDPLLLVAFPYANPTVLRLLTAAVQDFGARVLIDSGAFTAWKGGAPISLDDYCRFLEALPFTPWNYFALDVVHDAEATWRNYEVMRARGLKPVPIFQRGSPLDHLERYYSASDFVACGGVVGTERRRGFIRGLMAHVGARRIHWLGFADTNFIKAFRPYSVDVTSWALGQKFGNLQLYMGLGRFEVITMQEFTRAPSARVVQACERIGVRWQLLAKRANWTRGEAMRAGALSWLAFGDDAQRNIGTQVFLGVGCARDIRAVMGAVGDYRRTRGASVCAKAS